MRRLPPPSLAENLSKVLALVPELTDDLLASVDQPSVSQVCSTSGKPFLLCDYNRDGSAYRYTHALFPAFFRWPILENGRF